MEHHFVNAFFFINQTPMNISSLVKINAYLLIQISEPFFIFNKKITVIFFISLDIRIAPARALSFVEPDLVFGRGFTLGPGFGR